MRVPLPLNMIEKNFMDSLAPLSHILDNNEENDELSKVMLFHKLEQFYAAGEDHYPSIQFCDVRKQLLL